MNGQGILRYQNGDVYEGKFFENKREGEGVYNFSTGEIYNGGWA